MTENEILAYAHYLFERETPAWVRDMAPTDMNKALIDHKITMVRKLISLGVDTKEKIDEALARYEKLCTTGISERLTTKTCPQKYRMTQERYDAIHYTANPWVIIRTRESTEYLKSNDGFTTEKSEALTFTYFELAMKRLTGLELLGDTYHGCKIIQIPLADSGRTRADIQP